MDFWGTFGEWKRKLKVQRKTLVATLLYIFVFFYSCVKMSAPENARSLYFPFALRHLQRHAKEALCRGEQGADRREWTARPSQWLSLSLPWLIHGVPFPLQGVSWYRGCLKKCWAGVNCQGNSAAHGSVATTTTKTKCAINLPVTCMCACVCVCRSPTPLLPHSQSCMPVCVYTYVCVL